MMQGDKVKTAIALGNFDGMHMGHQAVMNETLRIAGDKMKPTVLLFARHSMKSLAGKAPPMLMTYEEKKAYFERSGFDAIIVDFEEIKDMSPEQFVDEILDSRLDAGAVVCGYNYHFGAKASGNSQILKELCSQKEIICSVVGEVDCDENPVSSSAVRRLIENGQIEKANEMLGHKFGYTSVVVDGDKRGRTWGMPTVNQFLPADFVVPAFGVYESDVTVHGKVYKGVTNVGKRPTVGTDYVVSETHILDFDMDIYGEQIDVRLIRFVRPEMKFNSFDELKAQMFSDILSVKKG